LALPNAAESVELILSVFGADEAIRLLATGVQTDFSDNEQSMIWGYAIVAGNEEMLTWLRDHDWVMNDNLVDLLAHDLLAVPNSDAVRILRTRTPQGGWWWNVQYSTLNLTGLGEMAADDSDEEISGHARTMLDILYETAEPEDREYFDEVYSEFPELAPAGYTPDV